YAPPEPEPAPVPEPEAVDEDDDASPEFDASDLNDPEFDDAPKPRATAIPARRIMAEEDEEDEEDPFADLRDNSPAAQKPA
nr:hypothetical protein [Tanacetum cinerariifolium]